MQEENKNDKTIQNLLERIALLEQKIGSVGYPLDKTSKNIIERSLEERLLTKEEKDDLTDSGETTLHTHPATTPQAHASSHEDGGSDEISVAGLSGKLADAQTPETHATSHEDGGSDEISVAGLSGELADPQKSKYYSDLRYPDDLRGGTWKTLSAAYTVPAGKRFYMMSVWIQSTLTASDSLTVASKQVIQAAASSWSSANVPLYNPIIVEAGSAVSSNDWTKWRVHGIELSSPDTNITILMGPSYSYTVPADKDLVITHIYSDAVSVNNTIKDNTSGNRIAGGGYGKIISANRYEYMTLEQPIVVPTGTVLNTVSSTVYFYGYLRPNS